MDNSSSLSSFEDVVKEFKDCILHVPEDRFLTPMNGWSPRDVIAHLIAWNGEMLRVCMGLQKGQTPAYYTDAPNDYSNINAGFIAKYDAQEKEKLLRDLEETKSELVTYLRSLPPEEWDADHGVIHYRGGAATIRRTIQSLAGDYRHHTQEILAWNNS